MQEYESLLRTLMAIWWCHGFNFHSTQPQALGSSRYQNQRASVSVYAKASPEAGSSVYNHSEECTEGILTEFMADTFGFL